MKLKLKDKTIFYIKEHPFSEYNIIYDKDGIFVNEIHRIVDLESIKTSKDLAKAIGYDFVGNTPKECAKLIADYYNEPLMDGSDEELIEKYDIDDIGKAYCAYKRADSAIFEIDLENCHSFNQELKLPKIKI